MNKFSSGLLDASVEEQKIVLLPQEMRHAEFLLWVKSSMNKFSSGSLDASVEEQKIVLLPQEMRHAKFSVNW